MFYCIIYLFVCDNFVALKSTLADINIAILALFPCFHDTYIYIFLKVFKINLFYFILFIFGCVGSSLLCVGFL